MVGIIYSIETYCPLEIELPRGISVRLLSSFASFRSFKPGSIRICQVFHGICLSRHFVANYHACGYNWMMCKSPHPNGFSSPLGLCLYVLHHSLSRARRLPEVFWWILYEVSRSPFPSSKQIVYHYLPSLGNGAVSTLRPHLYIPDSTMSITLD